MAEETTKGGNLSSGDAKSDQRYDMKAGFKGADHQKKAKRKSQKARNFLISCFLPPEKRVSAKRFEGLEPRLSKHGGQVYCSGPDDSLADVQKPQLDQPAKVAAAAGPVNRDAKTEAADNLPCSGPQERSAEKTGGMPANPGAETETGRNAGSLPMLGKHLAAANEKGNESNGVDPDEELKERIAAEADERQSSSCGPTQHINPKLEGIVATETVDQHEQLASQGTDSERHLDDSAEGAADTVSPEDERSSDRSVIESSPKSAPSDTSSEKLLTEKPEFRTNPDPVLNQTPESNDHPSNTSDSSRVETPSPQNSAREIVTEEEVPAGAVEWETRGSPSSSVSALSVVSPATLQGEEVLAWIRSQSIGINADVSTPFGVRQMTYADYIASGRCLQYVEDLLQARVLPYYGNTHTEDSACGQRTTHFAHEAGEYVKRCVRAGNAHKILFCGSGCTAAVKRLQEAMGIGVPSTLRARVLQTLNPSERWVVFVGPYEHHSNLLTWRQSLADVIEIPLSEDGLLDLGCLETELQDRRWAGRPKLGSFSAASNVTGILSDTRALARMLHKHGAYACLDYAAAAPYVDIDMRAGQPDGYDALLVSPHKFVGGPGSAGILILSEDLYSLAGAAPSTSGGGTVAYVNGHDEKETLYIDDIEQREDAGTPAILQKMRAAFAFWVKECVGAAAIERAESALIRAALARLGRNPRVEVLGNCEVPRLAVISFLIRPFSTSTSKRDGKALNGRFVVNLLNDLFGIQARGGCSCAGPYGHALMKVDRQLSVAIRDAIAAGNDSVKPGWTRLGFAYFITQAEFDFILSAIEFVAEHGLRFLPLYDFDWKTGNWQCKGFQPGNASLFDAVTVGEAAVLCNARADMFEAHANEPDAPPYERYLDEARALAATLPLTEGTDRARGPGIDERVVTFVV